MWVWSIWQNEDWQGKPKYSEKTCPSATLPTINPTWHDLGSNSDRWGGKPTTNRLSYGTALVTVLDVEVKWLTNRFFFPEQGSAISFTQEPDEASSKWQRYLYKMNSVNCYIRGINYSRWDTRYIQIALIILIRKCPKLECVLSDVNWTKPEVDTT
jgi:hypothetical protein